MIDRPTAAPAHFPYLDHRNMGEVLRDEYAASFHKPLQEPSPPEPDVARRPAPVPGKIYCVRCEIHWLPKAVRSCTRGTCPAKAEIR